MLNFHFRILQEVRQSRDPIISWKERMVSTGLADGDELKAMEKDVRLYLNFG